MPIAIVNLGTGNTGAIPNALRRLGADAELTTDPERLSRADKIVLPGVGAFDAVMGALASSGLIDVLTQRVQLDGVPFLGICVGMQLLGHGSAEGTAKGLGWIAGQCERLQPANPSLRVPHMGWSTVEASSGSPLFGGIAPDARYYFAHSYHLVCTDGADVSAWSTHGHRFAAAVQRGNVHGVQFHPEKSHRDGLRVLENFIAL